MSHILQ